MEPSTRTIAEVLRHAKACSRNAWDRDDRSRPLSDAGWHQAKHLVEALADPPPAAIYTSPALRCTQSVEAVAATLGLDPTVDERLAGIGATPPVIDRGSAWPAIAWLGARALAVVNEAIAVHPGQRVVVCSHGDVLAALLASIAGRDGLGLTDVSLRKGARMTLAFDADGRCVAAERVAAVPRSK